MPAPKPDGVYRLVFQARSIGACSPGTAVSGPGFCNRDLGTLEDRLAVLPGHGPQSTIGREKPWLQLVAKHRRLPW